MEKMIVTGGAGFIGSEFVRKAVVKGFDVVVIDSLTYAGDLERLRDFKERVKFYKTDITEKQELRKVFKKEKPSIVVHWAAESHVDRSILDSEPFIKTNIEGTLNLLNVSKDFGVSRFINISTDEVYGELDDKGYFFESSPLNPNSPYSVSKASADMLGRAFFRTYGLPVITVRPSNNYGPWQYPEKLIPVVILKALKNEKIPLYGSGKNIREWLFVSDCVEAVFFILEKGIEGEIYNIGSGEEKSNIDVVKKVLRILDRPEDLIEFVKDRPGHDFRYSLNSDKIRKLGWNPAHTFDEGIEKTIDWYLNNIKWIEEKAGQLKELWRRVYKK